MAEVLTNTQSFIEVQFPVSKVSKESYKERKANYSQTLTGLGKWWGRKPLILVRATIIGLLMPSTDDPVKDREIFLKILTMDDEGLLLRRNKDFTQTELYNSLTPRERKGYFTADSDEESAKLLREVSKEDKTKLQEIAFNKLSYDKKLEYSVRPENIEGPSKEAWQEINAHLKTKASNIQELVEELGKRKFGHTPKVGDAFCGGGSIPFEAARIGCEAFASDLNPVAALLTWAAFNIIGGGEEVVQEVQKAQEEVFNRVDEQITEWGIEHNDKGHRADAFLYCLETKCPECGWKIPLAPSWVIGKKRMCIAKLVPDEATKSYKIEIKSDVSSKEMKEADEAGTVKDSNLDCPHCKQKTPIEMIRGDRQTDQGTSYGLRMWENEDIIPIETDTFQERLYCVRWTYEIEQKNGKFKEIRYYATVEDEDLEKEQKVVDLLKENFDEWQKEGYIPSTQIQPGDKTDEPIRTRGWTHWHHLFNPRQLLLHGLFGQITNELSDTDLYQVINILGIGRCADWNGKLCRWDSSAGNERVAQTFYNQALNPLSSYATKGFLRLNTSYFVKIDTMEEFNNTLTVLPADARALNHNCDLWITDPPYADAVNYHELSEFFLAWYQKTIEKLFPEWYTDSKRALAVVGRSDDFRRSMVDCYSNLAKNMSDNGLQVVMFTHQDSSVWADLALILWASGLQVVSAWCILTETDTTLKEGNYVKGTVNLILKKQLSEETAFIDELYVEVEQEVKNQLHSMLELEDEEDPNFSDTDYQLAAYAAALRVLTKYKNIEDIDITHELSKPKNSNETSPIEKIIIDAVKVACDFLIPKGFDNLTWRLMSAEERFYLKGLDLESHGEFRSGAYQELARGFGIRDYRDFQSSTKANQTRLKSASEFEKRLLGDTNFGSSLVRNVLFAVREIVRTEDVNEGKNWLKTEIKDYWNNRKTLIEIARYLGSFEHLMEHWEKDSQAAKLLAGALENDHV